MIEDVWQNYDSVFKDAFILFKDKSLDFLGIDCYDKIIEILGTEKKEIEVDLAFSDLNFKTDGSYGIHMEEEVDISEKDLLRFCGYQVDLSLIHNLKFRTVILTIKKPAITKIDYPTLKFEPLIVNMGERDADEALSKLRYKIEMGEPINELELVFLPLYSSIDKTKTQLLKYGIELASKVKSSCASTDKLIALMIVLSNKIVDKDTLLNLWEEFRNMAKLKILEVAEEKGIEKGKLDVAFKMLQNGFRIENIVDMTGLTSEQIYSYHLINLPQKNNFIDDVTKKGDSNL